MKNVQADASIEVFFIEKEVVQADKTKLNESIAAAEELLKHAQDYAPEDIQNLTEVLDAAKTVSADPRRQHRKQLMQHRNLWLQRCVLHRSRKSLRLLQQQVWAEQSPQAVR